MTGLIGTIKHYWGTNLYRRYSKIPKNIRFDEHTIRLIEEFIEQQYPSSLTFSSVVRLGTNNFVQMKLEEDKW